MADLVFAFDPALDRPIPALDDAPPAVAAAVSNAAFDSLESAGATAPKTQAAALVLCGRVLDPLRASPAQAATLRTIVVGLAAQGCRTVFVADDVTACNDISRMLGEPHGLSFVTPSAPLEFEVRGLLVEIVSAHGTSAGALPPPGSAPMPLQRRVVIGWDSGLWHSERWDALRHDPHPGDVRSGHAVPDLLTGELPRPHAPALTAAAFAAAAAASPAWSHPGTFWIWGSRRRQALPQGLHHLPALQARSAHEASPGGCCTLTLLERDGAAPAEPFAAPHADWRGSWHEVPTHRVTWRTIAIESPAGGDEELATAIWSALESHSPAPHGPLEIVRCAVECGTSVARRVRVAEISAETLARLRQLYDQKTFRVWCREVFADPGESLAPLGHTRSGSRPGTTTSFSSALADIVAVIEQSPNPAIPADMAREAGWLALELVEST